MSSSSSDNNNKEQEDERIRKIVRAELRDIMQRTTEFMMEHDPQDPKKVMTHGDLAVFMFSFICGTEPDNKIMNKLVEKIGPMMDAFEKTRGGGKKDDNDG